MKATNHNTAFAETQAAKNLRGPKIFLLVFLCVLTLSSCKKKSDPAPNDYTYIQPGSGVFIGNEGVFNGGNASVMYYRFGDATPSGALSTQPGNPPLGDVLQSLFVDGSKLYMVLNNSQNIQAAQLPWYTDAGKISGLPSPRYMVKTHDDVAFVSNYGVNTLNRISLSQKSITGNIVLPDWSDAVLYHNGKLYVTTPASEMLYVCDPELMQVTDSIAIGIGGNGLVADKNGMIWAFAAGESWNNIPGKLVKIDPSTNQVITTFDAGITIGSAGRLCANATADTLYFLNGDVFRMSIVDTVLPAAFISAGSRNLYGLYRHPARSLLFVTDAKDFLQSGDVMIYNADGVLQNTLQAGVAPSSIAAY